MLEFRLLVSPILERFTASKFCNVAGFILKAISRHMLPKVLILTCCHSTTTYTCSFVKYSLHACTLYNVNYCIPLQAPIA